ncbi:MAG TPA: class I SAM-dependent methyltransferase [Anaerolineales bacterium]|jgi:SAM-dependent methyltransferase
MGIFIHRDLIEKNHRLWNRKPLLQTIYAQFYRLMRGYLTNLSVSRVVELGSGIGNIKEEIPHCLRTDLFDVPWVDQIENAYEMSFADNSVSDLIMVDVFHHLRYPGEALREFKRVLRPGGRVLIFEPCIGLLGWIVYGIFHVEPVAPFRPIEWFAPSGWAPEKLEYYAAQGNATRVFRSNSAYPIWSDWKKVFVLRLSALSYAASGGYSGPQLYPQKAREFVKGFEKVLDRFPALFATRMLVVLEKPA